MSGPSPMIPNGFVTATSPPSLVLRVTCAVVGALGLILGTVAVFREVSGAGATVLVLAGLVFVLLSIFWPLAGARFGRPRATSNASLVQLLESADPQVRLAAAEAVLGPTARDPRAERADLKELALGVLLDRDLVRRLGDLLRRSGHDISSDAIASASHSPAADVMITVDDDVSVPVAANPSSDVAPAAVLHRLGQVAQRTGSRSAVVIFTGAASGALPLPSTTTIGDVAVYTAYSPRLSDEVTVLSAVGQAVDHARPVVPALPPTPAVHRSPAHNGSASSVLSEEPQHS